MVGDGSLKETLKDLIKELKLEDQVLMTGALNGEQLYAWYYLADVFTLTSTREAFGAVVNEALVGGCFAVVSDHAGASTLINKENGYVFESGNCNDLKDKLQKALNKNLSKLHINKMPQTFEDFYKDLINAFFTK